MLQKQLDMHFLLLFIYAFIFLNLRIVVKCDSDYEDEEDNTGSGIDLAGNAKRGQFPHQLYIIWKKDFYCGAVLVKIMDIHIALTACHCLYTDDGELMPYNRLLIFGGTVNWQKQANKQVRRVTKVVFHEDCNRKQKTNNIAILFLDSDYDVTRYVKPIRLPEPGLEFPGYIFVSGWGSNVFNGKIPDIMRWDYFDALDWNKCNKRVSSLTEEQFCIAGIGTAGHCNGDAGGPAIAKPKGSNVDYLLGIVNYAADKDCRSTSFVGVHTNVEYYKDWIKTQVRNYLEENG